MSQQEYEPGHDCKEPNGFEEVPCRIEPIVRVRQLRSGALNPSENFLRAEKKVNAECDENRVGWQCVPMGLVLIGNGGRSNGRRHDRSFPHEGTENRKEHV